MRSSLLAAATQVLQSCGPPRLNEGSVFDPRLSARPRPPTVSPTRGFTPLGLGGDRDGLLFVPESYAPENPAPLFVGLHGAGGRGENWRGIGARAEERGMVFLAPDSRSDRSWDLMTTGRVDRDARFLDRSLRHVFERCHIDPSHLALGGFSDGATYALSLGVSNGDLFSHLIAYSPGYIVPLEPLVGKPPIFLSHGTRDTVLPVRGTRGDLMPLLRDSGYDVTYEEFDGGHTVPAEISEQSLNWFLG